ncbi:MAG TPA: RluA family pseudouridine synthase [Myxococcota bacterium]|nr:RluA family pseudouridine synthase [Myxococcota bacterium]
METVAPGVKALTVAADREMAAVCGGKSLLVPSTGAWSAEAMELSILFEDNHLLVVDKPAGLLSQSAEAGDENLVVAAQRYLKERYAKPGNVYVGLVHRLDRMTSGVVVLAKTSKAAERLSRAVREHRVDKRYLAVVAGLTPLGETLVDALVSDEKGSRVVKDHPDAKRAELRYQRLASTQAPIAASLLEIELGTGRKHQIRVQLASRGHPLLGDRRYGLREHDILIPRVALHAQKIALTHPVRGDELAFVAPIPKDFSALMACLGLALKPAGP